MTYLHKVHTIYYKRDLYNRYRERELGNECAVCAVCAPPQQLLPLNRPALPTGHSAVFFLNKGKGNGSRCPLSGAEGSTSPHFPPLFSWRVLLGGAAHRAAGGMIMPPKGSTQRGYPSGRFFGDFLIGEKVTRVQGGAPALEGSRNCPSAKNPFFWPCLFFLVKTFLCNKERVG